MNIPRAAFFLIVALSTSSVFGAAELSVPEKVDVGSLKGNELRKFEFTIKNTSSEEMEITKIASSCSCTNVKLNGSENLAPNAERVVSGEVHFGGTLGSYETKVTMDSQLKSGKIQTAIVPIRGKVTAALVLEKTRIDFGDVDLAADPQIVTLEAKRGNSGEEWDSIQPVGGNEHLDVTIQRDSDAIFRLTIKFDPSGLPISTFRDTVKIRLLQKGEPLPHKMELSISARVTGPLKVTPASIYLGAVTEGQKYEKVLTVTSSALDLQDLRIETRPEDIQAKVDQFENGAATVHVSITGPANGGTVNHTLVLSHRSSAVRLSVPIIGFTTSK